MDRESIASALALQRLHAPLEATHEVLVTVGHCADPPGERFQFAERSTRVTGRGARLFRRTAQHLVELARVLGDLTAALLRIARAFLIGPLVLILGPNDLTARAEPFGDLPARFRLPAQLFGRVAPLFGFRTTAFGSGGIEFLGHDTSL